MTSWAKNRFWFVSTAALVMLLAPLSASAATPPLVPFDLTGDLFVLDGGGESGCGCVLRITPEGDISIEISLAEILAATGESSVSFSDNGIAVGADGTLYFTVGNSESLLRFPVGGPLTVLVDEATFAAATGGVSATPEGVAFGSDGFLYVNEDNQNDLLRVDPSTGATTVYVPEADFLALAGVSAFGSDGGIVGAEGGLLYLVNDDNDEPNNQVFVVSAAGDPSILANGIPPFDDLDVFITRDAGGDLIVADDGNDTIFRVTPAGVVSVFLSESALEDFSCAGEDVDLEGGIAFDSDGVFYVAEESTGNIFSFAPGTLACALFVSADDIAAVTGFAPNFDGGIAFDVGAFAQTADRATFRVTKDFTDGINPTEVEVSIDCNTGLILDQDKDIVEGPANYVEFVVTSFTDGALDCHVTEDTDALPGYIASYEAGVIFQQGDDDVGFTDDADGCHFTGIPGGAELSCAVTNDARPQPVVITKEWMFEGSVNPGDIDLGYTLTLYCDDNVIEDGDYNCHGGNQPASEISEQLYSCKSFYGEGEDDFTAMVVPTYPGNSCYVTEDANTDYVESDASDCANLSVSAVAGGDSCTVTNLVFFEGIPTLSQYGMALLALLMLGVGMVGFRRYA